LFCIENKKDNKNELKSFIANSMYSFASVFVSNDVFAKDSFSFIIIALNLVDFFPLQVVQGFVRYLTPSKVKEISISKTISSHKKNIDYLDYMDYEDTIHKFLRFFPFFSTSFIQKCTTDCLMLGNLAPLSLALNFVYTNSISY
jgi:hypothetical protein